MHGSCYDGVTMRKLSHDSTLHEELNKAYAKYNPQVPGEPYGDRVLSFSNYVKERYGLELKLFAKIDNNQLKYELKEVYVVDEKKFTFFLLEWA